MDNSAFISGDVHLDIMTGVDTPRPRGVPQIAFLLRRQEARMIANWAMRVTTLPAFRATPELPLHGVKQNIADVLDSALIAVATTDPTMDPAPLARATELAAAHGRARLDDDFTIGDVLTEFHALRLEVWAATWRELDAAEDSPGLVRALQLRLDETFDAICVAAAGAWDHARIIATTAK